METCYTGPMATTVNFDHLLPVGEKLFDYQNVGVAYALVAAADGKGVFISDEQGLGKTRQALVACLALAGIASRLGRGYKTLVVCKSSLKGNWAKEISRIAPAWSIQTVGGTRPYELLPTTDIAIVSWDLLATWADSLAVEGFDALILDESHYAKSLGTSKKPVQRTVACLALSQFIRQDGGLVLLLSGTPLLNRPVELVTQLLIAGRLRDVAPRPRKGDSDRDWEYSFKFSFCGPAHNGHGYEFKGSSNLDVLNARLRGSCYVRRLRTEVLDMNETRRIEVPLSLNGALDRYKAAERDLVSYLVSNGVSDAAHKVNPLVELTTLRRLAGEAKVEAAIEWINDFLVENPGKKLVVWAWHVEIQKAIAKAVGGIYLSGVKDIEAAKTEFNEGEARVIVCSLQAHREGHTLVGNGHNVTDCLFVENPWHPGAKSQAEDRINRIGQEADAVFAWTLIAADADVDVWLSELIVAKWAVFRAAADGTVVDGDDTSFQNEILDRLRRKGEAA